MKHFFSVLMGLWTVLNLNGQITGNRQNILSDNDSINSIPTGFGSLPKQCITGAVSHIEAKAFNESVCKNTPLQLVQNKLNGLMMSIPNSSDPTNMEVDFAIRGINSIYGKDKMLYIIDGVPGNITSITPQDIKSFTLLRDLSSTGIFGILTNGPVMLIETKIANSNKLAVNYSTQFSTELLPKHTDVFSADEYRQYINKDISYDDYSYNTAWFDEIFRNNISQQHFISASGGAEHIKAYGSVAYRDMEGVVKKSVNQEIKSFLRLDINALDNRLNLNLAGRLNHSKQNPVDYEVFRQALQYNPTDRPYDDNGNYTRSATPMEYYNPVNLLSEQKRENNINDNFLKGSVEFKITDSWSIHANSSINKTENKYSEDYTDDFLRRYYSGFSYLRQTRQEDFLYFDSYTCFHKTFTKHFIGLTAGINYYKNEYSDVKKLYGTDSSYFVHWTSVVFSSGDSIKSHSFFGKLNYGYADKYFINLSFAYSKNPRAVGKHLNYPSISVGWVLSRERFMKSFNFIDEFKIRAGYGIKYEIYPARINKVFYDRFKSDDLNDQKISEINIGADWALFHNRLNGSFDVYKRKTPDLFMSDWGSLKDLGSVENKGIEIGVRAVPLKFKNFSWTIFANYSNNHNKVRLDEAYKNDYIDYNYMGGPIYTESHCVSDGQPLSNFYGYKSVDINVDVFGNWIIETPSGERVGIYEFPGTVRQVIGNGMPKHYLGIANTFTYKKFDFSMNLRGAFGFQVINFQRLEYENLDGYSNKLSSSNELVYGKATLDYSLDRLVSYYVEDGGYVKIDNLTLGYTTTLKKNISCLRVYLSAQNVFTFTKYKGIDPELNINYTDPGSESSYVHPRTTVFMLGANVSF